MVLVLQKEKNIACSDSKVREIIVTFLERLPLFLQGD